MVRQPQYDLTPYGPLFRKALPCGRAPPLRREAGTGLDFRLDKSAWLRSCLLASPQCYPHFMWITLSTSSANGSGTGTPSDCPQNGQPRAGRGNASPALPRPHRSRKAADRVRPPSGPASGRPRGPRKKQKMRNNDSNNAANGKARRAPCGARRALPLAEASKGYAVRAGSARGASPAWATAACCISTSCAGIGAAKPASPKLSRITRLVSKYTCQ